MVLFRRLHLTTSKQTIKASIQLTFLKQLSRSLSNGYALLPALETLKWDKNLKQIPNKVIKQLKSGKSLDQALETINFHPDISTYLYFAKDYGDLDNSINKCVELYEKRLEYTKKFTQVIRYPLILIVIFSTVFFLIQHSVLPNLLILFQQNEQDLQLVSISIFLSSLFYYSFIFTIIMTVIVRWIWNNLKISIPIESQLSFFSVVPFYRNYLSLHTSFLFSTHVSSLLKTGLPIKDVLSILSNQKKLPIISYYASILISGLNQGFHVSYLMEQFTFINPQLVSIFQKHSNVESLEKDLTTYSTFLTDELNQNMIKAITYIQPIFFIFLGFIIILIYLSLMLPMYQIIQTL